MSYAFDVMSHVWSKHIRKHVPDDRIAMRFEMLFEAMHSANHEVSYGVFEGDGLNKHPDVTKHARALDQLDRELKESEEDDNAPENESGQRQASDDSQR